MFYDVNFFKPPVNKNKCDNWKMWENRHESIAAEYTKRASKCAWLKMLK